MTSTASDGEKRKKPTTWGKLNRYRVWIFSAVYLIAFAAIVGPYDIWSFLWTEPDLNEIGDFLAGLFAPLALIWLIVAVLTQRQELQVTKDELKEAREQADEQRKVISAQLASVDKRDKAQEEQAIRTYRLSLFEHRIEVFNLVDEIGEDIRQRLDGDTANILARLARRSRFIFNRQVSDELRSISDKIREVAKLHSRLQQYRITSKGRHGTVDLSEYEATREGLVSAIEKRTNEIATALSYENRMALLARFLDVTDAAKEYVVRPGPGSISLNGGDVTISIKRNEDEN